MNYWMTRSVYLVAEGKVQLVSIPYQEAYPKSKVIQQQIPGKHPYKLLNIYVL